MERYYSLPINKHTKKIQKMFPKLKRSNRAIAQFDRKDKCLTCGHKEFGNISVGVPQHSKILNVIMCHHCYAQWGKTIYNIGYGDIVIVFRYDLLPIPIMKNPSHHKEKKIDDDIWESGSLAFWLYPRRWENVDPHKQLMNFEEEMQ